ncbi:neuromedin-K receptor-like, partial [Exaiptasia diaphana]|uniref:G-protein coupled receptors family 1 profile domain-containing protein n=1 Tax=Exaiptasia diaphana TaxID=2652724 RepID=A0A913WQ75_EXADI
ITGNVTVSSCTKPIDTTVQVVLTIGYAIIFPVALLGNSLVLYVVYRHQSLRNALNYLIVNMAIADLLVTILIMPYSTAYLFIQNLWFSGVFGDILCRLVHFSLTASIGASIFTLVTMTVDRFVSIVFVWRKSLTLGSSKLVLVLIWVLSFVMFGFNLRVYRVDFIFGAFRCYPSFIGFPPEFPKISAICFFVFLYAIPLLLMAVLYSIICYKLFKQKMAGGDREIDKKKKRVINMLITCTVFFALCWLPLHILHYYIYFNMKTYKCFPPLFILGGFWLGHANSAVNPCLYVIFNKTFRMAFLKALHLTSFDSNNWHPGTTNVTRVQRTGMQSLYVEDEEENKLNLAQRFSKRFRASFAKAYAKIRSASDEDSNELVDKRKSVVVVSERMTSL